MFSSVVEVVMALFNVLDLKMYSFLHFFKGQIFREKTAAIQATKNDGKTLKPFKYTPIPNMIRNQLERCVNWLNNFENLAAGFGV